MAIQPDRRVRENLRQLLALARAEDLGAGDVTSAMLPAEAVAVGRFVPREEIAFCGGSLLGEIAGAYDAGIETEVLVPDGDVAEAGRVLAIWRGPAAPVLAAERVALNFLQRLSGIATTTRRYVRAAGGTAGIYDTRKTTPGWRALEKYAVRAGGGNNHRHGLYDAVLVKDNHIAILSAAGVDRPWEHLRQQLPQAKARLGPEGFLEVEVDTLEQLDMALELGVDVILLDNMPPAELARAVARREAAGRAGQVALEASGGVSLADVAAVAAAGVDRIAIGALTHSASAVDIGLDIEIGAEPGRRER